jgi:hypothetical protein
VHAAVVYRNQDPAGCNVAAVAVAMAGCSGDRRRNWRTLLEWYEKRSAGDPDIPQRILNGFAVLRLDGSNITETFYDEKGGGGWP